MNARSLNGTKTPGLDSAAIPGEWFIERSATFILAFLVLFVLIGLLVLWVFTVDVTISADGTLEPTVVWTVRSREAGIVASVAAHSGDIVHTGELLVTLDSAQLLESTRDLESKISEASIDAHRAESLRPLDLARASESVALAQALVSRSRANFLAALVLYGQSKNIDSALRTPNRGTQIAIDIARSDVLQAQAQLRIAELSVDRLQRDSLELIKGRLSTRQMQYQLALSRARLTALDIRSPGTGVILTDQIDLLPGQLVHEGEPLMELGSLDGWRAQLLVSESQVREIKLGQAAQVDVSPSGDETIPPMNGRITSISPEPWRPVASYNGSGGSTLPVGSPQYRVILAMSGTSTDSVMATFRRGYGVRAHIRTDRMRLGRALFSRIFSNGVRRN